MYNHLLTVFKAVADCGSFSKAAELMYITHTAIIKQINQLEHHIGVKLFERSNQGIKLTAAGASLYEDTLRIMEFSDSAIKKAKSAENGHRPVIRIGTSMLYPCKAFFDLWYGMCGTTSEYSLSIIPFEDSNMTIYRLGVDFDCIIGAYNSGLTTDLCTFIKLGEYKFCIAVPRTNRLSTADRLHFYDLHGEILRMMLPGNSVMNDRIRQEIIKSHSEITIRDIEYHYDFRTFNSCAQNNDLLLSLSCWADVHPALASIPLDEGFALPYGIIAPAKPMGIVRKFIKSFNEICSM